MKRTIFLNDFFLPIIRYGPKCIFLNYRTKKMSLFMMDMDEYWKKAEPIIDQKKERKLIYGSYAISFIMIAASILILFLMVLRHE